MASEYRPFARYDYALLTQMGNGSASSRRLLEKMRREMEAAALENLVWQVAPENRPAGMNSAANDLRATILEARQRQVKRK